MIDLSKLNQLWIRGLNPTYYYLLHIVGFKCLYVHGQYWPIIFFSYITYLSDFNISVMLVSYSEEYSFPFFFFFSPKEFMSVWCCFILNIWNLLSLQFDGEFKVFNWHGANQISISSFVVSPPTPWQEIYLFHHNILAITFSNIFMPLSFSTFGNQLHVWSPFWYS